MTPLALTGAQMEKLHEGIASAYDAEELERLLTFRLDRRLDRITTASGIDAIAFDVLTRSHREGWTDDLLIALRHSRPDRVDLFEVTGERGLSARAPSREALQRMVNDGQLPLDVPLFLKKFAELEPRVCRISYAMPGGTVHGTGFLVGPDRVLTNNHVIRPVVDGKASAAAVRLVFDYRRLAPETAPEEETTLHLADDWLLDSSPHSALDVDPHADPDAPRDRNELDYALLKLAEQPGLAPIGPRAEPGAAKRGWVALEAGHEAPAALTVLFVLQHPLGQPIKVAFGPVLANNGNQTRVRYRVNTEGGSSGAPGFVPSGDALTLSVLHHGGDPNFEALHRPTYNQGIPTSLVRGLIEERGAAGGLGAAEGWRA